jgi:PKD repeat protein
MINLIRKSFILLNVVLFSLSLVLPVQALTVLPGSYVPGDDTVGTAAANQFTPAIANGNGNFLAVWSDQRSMGYDPTFSETETSNDIYGILLDADGNLLDTLPFVVTAAPGSQENPQVVWNGSNWLVVFESYGVHGTGQYYEKTLAAVRVSPDGNVLDSAPIILYNIVPTISMWAVASDGNNWVVAFSGTAASYDLMALRISPDGVVLDPPIHSLVPETYYLRFHLRLAYADGVFLLTWDGASDAMGIRFDQEINLLDTEPITLMAGSYLDGLTSNGSQFYAVWDAWHSDWGMSLSGSRISIEGVMLDGAGVNISQDHTPDPNLIMSVVWDGTNWKAYWSYQGVSVARIAPDGQVLDPGGVQVNSLTVGPAAASPSGGLQMLWADYDTTYDVFSAAISAGNVGGPVKIISTGAPEQLRPDVAQGNVGYMIVYRSGISGQNRIMAQPLDASGDPLTTEPVQLDTGDELYGPGAPAVAWNGSLYLVAWTDNGGIYSQRIQQDGTLVDASPIYVMVGYGAVDVAALGDIFLVTSLWTDYPEFVYPRAARVRGSDGVVLDPGGFLVGGSFTRFAAVAAVGNRWLVVWQEHSSHDSPIAATAGVFVNADGSLTTSFTVYGPYTTSQYSFGPAIASNGDTAMVLQVAEISSGVEMDLAGMMVYSDGSLGTAVTLTPWEGNQYRPNVAWDGSNFIAVYQDQRNRFAVWELDQIDARADLFGMRVTDNSTILDPRGFLISNSPQAESYPNITASNGLSLISASILRNEPYAAYRVGYDLWGEGGNAWPVAVASASPDEGIVPLQVNFSASGSTDLDGSLAAYAWDFGDGASSTDANPTHIYSVGGPFVATLTVTDNQGAQTTNTVLIRAALPNQLPVVQANAVPDVGPAPLDVTFNASGSYDPDGSLGNFYWTFSDGGDSWGPTAYHTFNTPGLHSATLTVYDSRGGTNSDTVTVMVSGPNVAPVLAPIGNQTAYELETLVLTATATDANQPPQLLTFSLGPGEPDGASIDPLSGVFTWTPPAGGGPGTYPVKVIVTDDGIPVLNDSETIQIAVYDPLIVPEVNAGVDQTVLEGGVISFTGTYTDPQLILGASLDVVGIKWDFGDSSTIYGTLTPTHTYVGDGIFNVTLVITNELGGVGQDELIVTVENALPEIEPLDPVQYVKAGEELVISGGFTDPGLLDAHTLTMMWGDGMTETLELESGVFEFTFNHVYASAGTYLVTLSIADDDGETVTSFTVEVSLAGYLISLPLVRK